MTAGRYSRKHTTVTGPQGLSDGQLKAMLWSSEQERRRGRRGESTKQLEQLFGSTVPAFADRREVIAPDPPPAAGTFSREEFMALMKSHPAADLFPMMSDREFEDHVQSIKDHGQLDDIVVHEGLILDGRHRYRAVTMLGLVPKYVEWDGECGSPTAFVLAKNLKRRQLTESQRAIVAARSKTMFEEEAAARKAANGGDRKSAKATPAPIVETKKASEAAAEAVGVSASSVERATRVLNEGAAELVEAVEKGTLPVKTAAEIAASLTKEQQREILKNVDPREIKAAAKELKKQEKLERVENDFYPTPEWMTRGLLRHFNPIEGFKAGSGVILEICSGENAIANVLESFGYAVLTNDIDPKRPAEFHCDARAPGPQTDLFAPPSFPLEALLATGVLASIVSNTPYDDVANEIVARCVATGRPCAFLLRNTWLEPTKERSEFFQKNEPAGVVYLPRDRFRADTKATDMTGLAWVCWNCTPFGIKHIEWEAKGAEERAAA